MAIDKDQVSRVLDLIRPALQADGGDVQLVDVDEEGVVTVQLHGACNGCPMSQMTLANGVERILKEHIPASPRSCLPNSGHALSTLRWFYRRASGSSCGSRIEFAPLRFLSNRIRLEPMLADFWCEAWFFLRKATVWWLPLFLVARGRIALRYLGK